MPVDPQVSIDFEPNLYFPRPYNRKIINEVAIKNLVDNYVAFKIRNPNPDLFVVKPSSGFIFPNKFAKVEFQLLDDVPENLKTAAVSTEAAFEIFFKCFSDPFTLQNRGWKSASLSDTAKRHVLKCVFSEPAPDDDIQQEVLTGDNNALRLFNTKTRAEAKSDFATLRARQEKYVSVKYGSTLNKQLPLHDFYFNKNNKTFVSKYDVTEEIDIYFCPVCLQDMSSNEAMLYRGRCNVCCECPSCTSTLSVVKRTMSGRAADKDSICYFSCLFCKWTSLHLGLQAEVPTDLANQVIEHERELTSEKQLRKLIDFFQEESNKVAEQLRDENRPKQELSRLMQPLSLSYKAPITVAQHNVSEYVERILQHKQVQLSDKNQESLNRLQTTIPATSIIADHEDPALAEVTAINFDPAQISDLNQRLAHPSQQNSHVRDLWPQRKALLTKRSKRSGDRLVVKPEMKPNSLQFLKFWNMSAVYFVPKVTILEMPALHYQQEAVVKVLFVNPMRTHSRMQLFLQEDYFKTSSHYDHDVTLAPVVEIPNIPVYLIGNDETLLEDDEEEEEDEKLDYSSIVGEKLEDDARYVAFRKLNKLVLNFRVKPMAYTKDVAFAIKVEYDFQSLEMERLKSHFYLFFNLGPVEEKFEQQQQQQQQQQQP